MEDEYSANLRKVLDKRGDKLPGDLYSGLLEQLRERADAASGFAEWLRAKVMGRTREALEMTGDHRWPQSMLEGLEAWKLNLSEHQRLFKMIPEVEREIQKVATKVFRAQAIFDPTLSILTTEMNTKQQRLAQIHQCLRALEEQRILLYQSFVGGSARDFAQHQATKMMLVKEGLVELIGVTEERAIWENGILDRWKILLFNLDPAVKAARMVTGQLEGCTVRIACKEQEAVDRLLALQQDPTDEDGCTWGSDSE